MLNKRRAHTNFYDEATNYEGNWFYHIIPKYFSIFSMFDIWITFIYEL